MAFARSVPALRAVRQHAQCTGRRTFSSSSIPRASVLFALNSLSNSRETQHFNKLSHLNRIEHSPPLKLIKTSEVDSFPLPTPTPKPAVPLVRNGGSSRLAARVWDDKALKAGRVLLADNARHVGQLQHALIRAKRREARQETAMRNAEQSWQQEAQKLRNDMRIAGLWIVASIATATALAT